VSIDDKSINELLVLRNIPVKDRARESEAMLLIKCCDLVAKCRHMAWQVCELASHSVIDRVDVVLKTVLNCSQVPAERAKAWRTQNKESMFDDIFKVVLIGQTAHEAICRDVDVVKVGTAKPAAQALDIRRWIWGVSCGPFFEGEQVDGSIAFGSNRRCASRVCAARVKDDACV
jgi:hypothetical protein